ncbi:MAG: hypothetical protein Q7T66_08990 [Herminiimonas sp.]|uniref:chorismate transformation enzyme, FkbO/Hyg5 family n=1 Tax=Herminiimonas sp. TaxID=1926289 RepID=UPI00271978AE|nr:hypothetical protein [Herminiimonas sp.]MDO9420785.1 hypothetical protein [Herminiimonas sp.]
MLKVSYCNTSAQLPHDLSGVLGTLCFVPDIPEALIASGTAMQIMMPVLDGQTHLFEMFHADNALTTQVEGDICYRFNEHLLFGVVTLDEARFASSAESSPLQAASRSAYEQIFALLDSHDFPFVLRFWNYMADINSVSHELERYRQFNLGRQQAFSAKEKERAGNVPAACALGASKGPLTIAFLAGRTPSLPIENPRQVSAYDYPVQYGPRSPLFSRASVAPLGDASLFFLSGTASIVGHETLHPNDVAAQTEESLTNVEAVLDEACRKTGKQFELASLDYIVYIRHPTDLPAIKNIMERRIGPNLKAAYVQADICRSDLLVEIEGSAELS